MVYNLAHTKILQMKENYIGTGMNVWEFGQSLLLTSNDVHDSQTILSRRNSTYSLLLHQKMIETTEYNVESTLQLKFFFDTLTKNLMLDENHCMYYVLPRIAKYT